MPDYISKNSIPLSVFKILITLILLLFLCAVFFTQNIFTQDISHQQQKPTTTPQHQHQTVLSLTIPLGLKPITTLEHSAWIGTADHPTINGGMINTADGSIINQDKPIPSKPIIFIPANKDNSLNIAKNLDDHWASSEKVKLLLKQAAESGKLNDILNKSADMQLPASVALLPMLESNYHKQALSKQGAAGPWQLMPTTAHSLGLRQEQRFEWEPATQAALTYLNQLHQEFHNWNLAYAAYNAGPYRVETALRKNPLAESIEDLDLPKETQKYVEHLQAINRVLEQE